MYKMRRKLLYRQTYKWYVCNKTQMNTKRNKSKCTRLSVLCLSKNTKWSILYKMMYNVYIILLVTKNKQIFVYQHLTKPMRGYTTIYRKDHSTIHNSNQ